MTTTDKPTFHTSKPQYLTDEYEVVRKGRTFRCRKFVYRGDEYESCYEVGATTDVLEEIFAGKRIKPDDPIYQDLVDYLDQFLIESDDSPAE